MTSAPRFSPSTRARPHVLVIDPDDSNRHFLAWTLRAEGYRVSEASTAAEAAAVGQADLVIADSGLPSLQPATEIPLVLMTASLSGAMRDLARHLGATCSIHRPIYVDELKQAVSQALLAGRRSRTTTQPSSSAQLPAASAGL